MPEPPSVINVSVSLTWLAWRDVPGLLIGHLQTNYPPSSYPPSPATAAIYSRWQFSLLTGEGEGGGDERKNKRTRDRDGGRDGRSPAVE